MTIDVNIPESAVEILTDKVLKTMDLDSTISDAIDNSELSAKVDELESKIDDMDIDGLERKLGDIDVDDLASQYDLDRLIKRVDTLEEGADKTDLRDLTDLESEFREFKSDMLTLIESLRSALNVFVSTR
jgi:hypothetical protein